MKSPSIQKIINSLNVHSFTAESLKSKVLRLQRDSGMHLNRQASLIGDDVFAMGGLPTHKDVILPSRRQLYFFLFPSPTLRVPFFLTFFQITYSLRVPVCSTFGDFLLEKQILFINNKQTLALYLLISLLIYLPIQNTFNYCVILFLNLLLLLLAWPAKYIN